MLRLRWILLAAFLGLFAAIMGTEFFLEFRKIARLTSLTDERMVRLVSMSRSVQELREKVSFYSTPEGVAHLAREQYNLSFPGERVFRLEVQKNSLPRKKQ
ncbi:MAG: septum formation initiator [Synergistaceae bacterium]|uniref:septum formation initiator n=1 Tax=Aminivibrio sp. TaxID=1872489 RepID=UPI001E0C5AF5|nr:septum formation initiator [Synergistaceae bacterium]NCC56844.1 septum formation initiator [Synergistales bacterium]MDD3390232.1 septum formation initiator [Synergistaceae bacterium]MDD3689353.1 septum formation initiator [Synergistaceae bacterium]MDD4020183.1 septum formation initiator [Synergistaceae bacterium]